MILIMKIINTKKKLKKKFDFTDEKSIEEKKVNDKNNKKAKRKIHKHKSGRGNLMINSKNDNNDNNDNNTSSSSSSSHSNKKKRYSSQDGKNKENPINILKKGKKSLALTNENFSFKEYVVKNYQPKPYIIWKKQIKKYTLSKQIDFSILAKIVKKPQKNIKTILFNINSSDINKKKNNSKIGGRKSVFNSFNRNNLLNLAERFDISRYEEKLSNIQKKKNELMNEKKNINTEFAKKRKRYQSILLTDLKSINELGSKLNNNNNKDSSVTKKNNPKKRLSVFEILQKRGLNPTFLENMNTDSNESPIKKRVKFGYRPSIIRNKENKNKLTKLEDIPEKEEDIIKETNDGVKYIIFQKKNDLKTINKKEKWKLVKSDKITIFLKAIKPQIIPKEKIIKNNNQIKMNNKNKAELEKIYKNKVDNNKIENISLKYPAQKKTDYKINNFSKKEEESNDSSSSKEEIENNSNINKNTQKPQSLDKDIKKEQTYQNHNTLNKYYFNSPTNITTNNIQENKATSNKKLKTINSGSNISETSKKNDDYDYMSDYINKRYKKGQTLNVRKHPRIYELNLDEQEKKIGKVRTKKAKIKKFKSTKDAPEPIDNERRKKGNLYDYYSSKMPKKKKNCIQYDDNIDEFDINSRKVKTIQNKSEYNHTYNKTKKIKRNNSDQRSDVKIRNNTSIKKPKMKINPVIVNKKNNSSLTSTYRQKILDNMQNMSSEKKSKITNEKQQKNYINKNLNTIKKKKEKNIKLNSSLEMIGIDAIKSKMKKKLIEINNTLLDAVDYYNGPIDISCISLNNYIKTIDDLNKRALKNGYTCSKIENNYYNLTNQFNSFLVQIVKIRNNMLYYLIVKNE